MTQQNNYELMMAKVIGDRWKREIEYAIDCVKYGEAFCAERRRLNLQWRQMWRKSEEQRKARIWPLAEHDYSVEWYSD